PRLGPGAGVAPTATVIGRVELGAESSVWWGSVIRADNDPIVIGARCNIQDGAVLHTDEGVPMRLGDGVSVGHQAMLHGCIVGDGALIGIQAVVLNGARIGRNCLVGAGALLTEGKEFPDGALIVGSPAKVVRMLTPEQIEGIRHNERDYVENALRYVAGLKPLA
ncbi:MAG TPA: gamma carbonic anhydrase family protein, partial [Casimicrobiaceae bacterium]|nr:gamma carbonic anhydrase family protein [Casimicrobiaceae bacterium]